jgi:hypothetical protein
MGKIAKFDPMIYRNGASAMSGTVLVFARGVASGRDNETHAGSNMMKSKASQSIGTVSLGETCRPRTLEKLDRYTIERSIQDSSPAQPY